MYEAKEKNTLKKKCQEVKGHFWSLSTSSMHPHSIRSSLIAETIVLNTDCEIRLGILRPKRKKTEVNDEEILQKCAPLAFEFKDRFGISILLNLVILNLSH